MKTYNLNALIFTLIVRLVAMILPWLYIISYGITSNVGFFLTMASFIGLLATAREYKTGFSMARNITLFNIIWPYIAVEIMQTVLNTLDGNNDTYIYDVVMVILFTLVPAIIEIGLNCSLSKGINTLLKKNGHMKQANTISKLLIFNIAIVVLDVAFKSMSRIDLNMEYIGISILGITVKVLLYLFILMGALSLNKKPIYGSNGASSSISHEFRNNTNYARNNQKNNQQSGMYYDYQKGSSTRDEVYKQFEE